MKTCLKRVRYAISAGKSRKTREQVREAIPRIGDKNLHVFPDSRTREVYPYLSGLTCRAEGLLRQSRSIAPRCHILFSFFCRSSGCLVVRLSFCQYPCLKVNLFPVVRNSNRTLLAWASFSTRCELSQDKRRFLRPLQGVALPRRFAR